MKAICWSVNWDRFMARLLRERFRAEPKLPTSAGPIFRRQVSAHAAAEPVNPELLCYVK